MKLWVALGIMGIVSGGCALAEQPSTWEVSVDVEMVSVSMKEGVRLLPNLRRPETFDEALASIQKLVATDEAELLGWPTLESQSGEKAMTHSFEELRYGTEYEPPTLGGSTSGPSPPPTLADLIPRPFDVPTAFNTREVGPILECEAVVEPGTGDISLELVVQHVGLVAMEPGIAARAQRHAGDQIPQPRFSVFSTKTSLTLRNGGRVLLDTFNLEAPEPRMVFFLLHASAKAPLHP